MSHPLFVRSLMPAEQKEVRRLTRSNKDARTARRAQMIHLSAGGHTASQIAEQWAICPNTVLRLIRRFDAQGLSALKDKPRAGRPPRATPRYVVLLKELVMKSPRELGYSFSSWTLERLREHLATVTGVVLHPRYLSRLMAKHGIVYRRPKHVMAHLRDPKDYDEKKAFLDFLKKARSSPKPASICSSLTSVRFTSTRP